MPRWSRSFFEFGRSFLRLVRRQVRFAPQVDGIESGKESIEGDPRDGEVEALRGLQQLAATRWSTALGCVLQGFPGLGTAPMFALDCSSIRPRPRIGAGRVIFSAPALETGGKYVNAEGSDQDGSSGRHGTGR
jgi:hypothetical protein